MEIHITDPVKIEVFSNIVQNIKNVCDQVNIEFNEDRLYIQTMDSSKISILEISIASNWFTSYRCPIPVTIGVIASLFVKILSARDKSQCLHIVYDDVCASDTLHCKMTGEAINGVKSAFDRSFDIPLMEIETENLSMAEGSIAKAVALVLVSSLLHKQPHTLQIAFHGSSMQIHLQTNANRVPQRENFNFQLVVVLCFRSIGDVSGNGQIVFFESI